MELMSSICLTQLQLLDLACVVPSERHYQSHVLGLLLVEVLK